MEHFVHRKRTHELCATGDVDQPREEKLTKIEDPTQQISVFELTHFPMPFVPGPQYKQAPEVDDRGQQYILVFNIVFQISILNQDHTT